MHYYYVYVHIHSRSRHRSCGHLLAPATQPINNGPSQIQPTWQWHSQSFKVGRVQPASVTVLIEYLTVLLQYFDLFNFCWQGTIHIWVGLGPVRPALGYAPATWDQRLIIQLTWDQRLITLAHYCTSMFNLQLLIYHDG